MRKLASEYWNATLTVVAALFIVLAYVPGFEPVDTCHAPADAETVHFANAPTSDVESETVAAAPQTAMATPPEDAQGLTEAPEQSSANNDIWIAFGGIAVLALIVVIFMRVVSGAKKSNVLLRYIGISIACVAGALVYKHLLFDPCLTHLTKELVEDGAFKELFALEITLFSFLAGFILLNALQEYSEVKRDRSHEIQHWHSILALLHFFLNSEGKRDAKSRDNHKYADEAITRIRAMDSRTVEGDSAPENTLKFVYSKILELRVLDDNDSPALHHLVNQYIKLNVLINARNESKNDDPNSVLVVILWLVGILTLAFAYTAAFWTMNSGFLELSQTPWGRFSLATIMLIITLPVTIIIQTISDLKKHDSGLWSTDIHARYESMTKSMQIPDEGTKT